MRKEFWTAVVAAWILVALGIGHTVVGLVRFKKPLVEAIRAEFVGQFVGYPGRRDAFWFMIFGPLLVMAGHVAVHAANAANREVLKIIGFYLLAISAVGSLAQPTSPFWAGLVSALILIGTGYGWICKSQSRNAKPCLAIASTGPQRLGALVPDAAQRSV